MHNLSNEFFTNEMESEINQEYGFEISPEYGFEYEYAQSHPREKEYDLSPEFEFESEFEFENPQSESELLGELAQELKQGSDKAEIKQVIKKTAKKVAKVGDHLVNSPAGQKAADALTHIAKKALPRIVDTAADFNQGKLNGSGRNGSNGDAGKFIKYIRFVADVFEKLANHANTGANIPVKETIINAASRHFPMILKTKNEDASEKEYEWNNETQNEYESGNMEGTFNEVTQMELASELLSISNEAGLDHFINKLCNKASDENCHKHKSPLGNILKGLAKKVLPVAGGILGSAIPVVGTAIGGAVGSAVANVFELELEGLSGEDREFEVAKAFVRFAGDAARRGSRMRNLHPRHAARLALIKAARRHAPGLVQQSTIDATTYSNNVNYTDGNTDQGNIADSTAGTSSSKAEEPVSSEIGTWRRINGKIVLDPPAFKKRH